MEISSSGYYSRRTSIIYTRETDSNMRENLYSLYTYISRVKPDIEILNEYTNINYDTLVTRGERCEDMMPNLFNGYLAVRDKEFVMYIQKKRKITTMTRTKTRIS